MIQSKINNLVIATPTIQVLKDSKTPSVDVEKKIQAKK